ncbi:MAG: lipopolysaccharide biosynthesis protein [Candidatus Zhuqueibacterota bacterium]
MFREGENLSSKTKRGSIWVFFTNIIGNILNVIVSIVLARWFLGPEEFGLVSITILVSEVIRMLSSQGICDVIIYMKDDRPIAINTLFIMATALGLFLAGVTVALIPALVSYFKHDELRAIFPIVAITYPFISGSSITLALLRKELKFKNESFVLLVSQIISTATTLILVFLDFNVYAVIYGMLAKAVATFFISFWSARYFPKFEFDFKVVKDTFNYVKYVTGELGVMFLLERTDQTVIPRFLGTEAMGFYTTAFNFVEYPLMMTRMTFHKVLFSGYSKLNDKRDRLKEVFLEISQHISIFFIPLFVGLGAVAQPFIHFVIGPKWQPCVLLVQIISLYAVVKTIAITFPQVMKAVGKPKYLFYYNLGRVVIMIPALILAAQRSIITVAVTMVAILWLSKPVQVWMLHRSIGVTVTEFMKTCYAPLLASAVMFMSIIFAQRILPEMGNGAMLAVLIFIGIVVYFGGMLLISYKQSVEFKNFIRAYFK